MRVTLVHNPGAGDGPPSRAELEALVRDAGHEVVVVSSDERWQEALQDPGDLVAACGGDGTVRGVVRELARRRSAVPFTVLPLGTANNVAKSLGVLGWAPRIVAGWAEAAPRPFDVGRVEAPWGDGWVVEAVGGGVVARLIARGEEIEEAHLLVSRETDRALYLLREVVAGAEPERWTVEADGADLSGDYLGVEVMNVPFAGPNVPLAPDAAVGDGRLDVVLVEAGKRDALVDYLGGRLERGGAMPPRLRTVRAERVRLVPPDGMPLHLDDALWPAEGRGADGRAELRVEIRAAATRVVAPG